MSETDGPSSRPGSGPASGSAVSSGPGGSSAASGSGSAGDTRPMSTGGSGGSGGSGVRTATAVPAESAAGKQVAAPKRAAPVKQGKTARPAAPAGRRVRLTVSRIDPWSAMKMSFLLSVAIGIAMVVMTFVLWSVLAGMGVFEKVNDIAANVFPVEAGEQAFDLMNYIGLPKVMSLAIVIGVIDVILITAIATLGAFLYNVSSALVGGLQLTLTDD